MSKSLRKNKKLIASIRLKKKEIRFLKETESDFEDLFSIYENELNEIISDLYSFSKAGEVDDEKELNEDNNSSFTFDSDDVKGNYDEDGNLDTSQPEKTDHPSWAKKLYKQIALQTHPDKILSLSLEKKEILEREIFFKKAKQLLDSGKYEELVIEAENLGIEFEVEDEAYLVILKENYKKIKQRIKSKKEMVPWEWGKLDDSIDRQKFFLSFVLSQMKEKSIPSEVLEAYLKAWKNNTINEWKLEYVDNKEQALEKISSNNKRNLEKTLKKLTFKYKNR